MVGIYLHYCPCRKNEGYYFLLSDKFSHTREREKEEERYKERRSIKSSKINFV